MEKQPSINNIGNIVKYNEENNIESIKLKKIDKSDIENGDRAMVTTVDGKQYGFARDKNGYLKVFIVSEDDFKDGKAKFLGIADENIATKGTSMHFAFKDSMDTTDNMVHERKTAEVESIEIRKNYEADLLADRWLKILAEGRVHSSGYDPEWSENLPQDYASFIFLARQRPDAMNDYLELLNMTDSDKMYHKVNELNEKYDSDGNVISGEVTTLVPTTPKPCLIGVALRKNGVFFRLSE